MVGDFFLGEKKNFASNGAGASMARGLALKWNGGYLSVSIY
jgi:hypothetical protein